MKTNTSLFRSGNSMKYKNYYAIPQFSAEDRCFYGILLGIRDCMLFEGRSVKELEEAFKDSVDEYLDQCQREGIPPQKPYSGKFNLRMPPELHVLTAQTASRKGKNFNQWIVDAVTAALGK